MTLKPPFSIVEKTLKGKQTPDQLEFKKQWSNDDRLIGWWVECIWRKDDGTDLRLCIEITAEYTQTTGCPLQEVPEKQHVQKS